MSGTPSPAQATVLVTGGSGFIGGWCAADLLDAGFSVRTTIRDLRRQSDVRTMIERGRPVGDRLTVVAADLYKDEGWRDAARGCDYVIHVASPMPIGEYRGHHVLEPARDGTLRVLEAALAAGVRRVVVTSSASAAMPAEKGGITDETVWSDLPDDPVNNYPRAKTLAERAAWDFSESKGLELSTVLPAMVQGPVLGPDYSASVDVVGLMLRGKMPAVPRLGYNVVDVRDLAVLHRLAMTKPEAAGQRFFGSGEFVWMREMAEILQRRLGPEASRVSRLPLPDIVVRIGALFNDVLKQMEPGLGVRSDVPTTKAETVLGWRGRPAEDCIVDTARSLIDRGLV